MFARLTQPLPLRDKNTSNKKRSQSDGKDRLRCHFIHSEVGLWQLLGNAAWDLTLTMNTFTRRLRGSVVDTAPSDTSPPLRSCFVWLCF